MSIADRIHAVAAEEHCTILDDGTILFREPWSGRICLKVAIEDEFGIPDISDSEMERCSSVADWVELVEGKMG